MTRSSSDHPYSGPDRYDAESIPSDDFVNVFESQSDDVDRNGCNIQKESRSSHPRASLHRAAKQLLDHLSDGNEELLDVDGVAEFLQIPRPSAHCILDVLDVFQVRQGLNTKCVTMRARRSRTLLQTCRLSSLADQCTHGGEPHTLKSFFNLTSSSVRSNTQTFRRIEISICNQAPGSRFGVTIRCDALQAELRCSLGLQCQKYAGP